MIPTHRHRRTIYEKAVRALKLESHSPEEHEGLVLHGDEALVELLEHDAGDIGVAALEQVQRVVLRERLRRKKRRRRKKARKGEKTRGRGT